MQYERLLAAGRFFFCAAGLTSLLTSLGFGGGHF